MTALDQWTDRFEIKSSTSSRVYVVAKRTSGANVGTWGCSCPAFKSHRRMDAAGRTTCKHLLSMNLEGPAEAHGVSIGMSDGSTFTDEAYRHYDTRGGFGSAAEWFRQAEAKAQGRGRYHGRGYQDEQYRRQSYSGGQRQQYRARTATFTEREDLVLLGLSERPADVKGLKAAMRAKAFKLHPDYGGDEAAFKAMFAAYERLLRNY